MMLYAWKMPSSPALLRSLTASACLSIRSWQMPQRTVDVGQHANAGQLDRLALGRCQLGKALPAYCTLPQGQNRGGVRFQTGIEVGNGGIIVLQDGIGGRTGNEQRRAEGSSPTLPDGCGERVGVLQIAVVAGCVETGVPVVNK